MKTIFQFGFLLFISLSLSNCGGDDDTPNTPKQIRLKSFIVNTDENTFSYDDDNKLSSYNQEGNIHQIAYNSDGKITKNGNYTYFYNDQGRIRQIVKEDDDLYRNQYSDITYENANLLSQATHLTYVDSGTLRTINTSYKYNSSNQLIEIVQQESGLLTAYKYEYRYDSNNNINKVIVLISSDSGATFTTNITYTYTYDTKKNPHYLTLNKLGITNSIGFVDIPKNSLGIAGYFFRPLYYSPNNITSVSNTAGGSETNTYTYNEYDYPLTKKRVNTSTTNYSYAYETY